MFFAPRFPASFHRFCSRAPFPGKTKHKPSSLSLIFLTKESTRHRQTSGGPYAILLIRHHSIPGRRAPAHRSGLCRSCPIPRQGSAPAQTAASAYSGNAKTRIFHASGCRYFNCKACTVRFKSIEEARSNGYTPCKRCLPSGGK